jgi:hypothetical protein
MSLNLINPTVSLNEDDDTDDEQPKINFSKPNGKNTK